MSDSSANRISRVTLKGFGNASHSTYRVNTTTDEVDRVSKGTYNAGSSESNGNSSKRDSSVGNKTLTQDSASTLYHVDAARMRLLLNALKDHAGTNLEHLPTHLKDHLNAIKQIYNSTDQDSGHDQLVALIDEVFGDINAVVIVPGTVASFFLGCKMSNCNGVSLGCTPHCAGSLPSDPNLTGYAPCDAAVYIYQNGVLNLSTHGSKGNSNAYVYVSSSFKGYTDVMIKRLSQNGVKAVKTVYIENGKCTQMSPDFVVLVNLQPGGSGHHSGSSGSSNANMWWCWVLLAILIILILGGIWALASRGRHNSAPASSDSAAMGYGTSQRMGAPPMPQPSSTNQPFSSEFFQNMGQTFSSPLGY